MPLESALISVIKSRLVSDYGNCVLSMVGRLSVVEYLSNSRIAVIKCDAEVCKYVLSTMRGIGEVSGIECSMRILWVSGILKKAMKKVLRYVRMDGIHGDMDESTRC